MASRFCVLLEDHKPVNVIWALPTIREFSRGCASPIDIIIMDTCAYLKPLLEVQSYIGDIRIVPKGQENVYEGLKEYAQHWIIPQMDFTEGIPADPVVVDIAKRFKIDLYEPLPFIELSNNQDMANIGFGIAAIGFTEEDHVIEKRAFAEHVRIHFRGSLYCLDVAGVAEKDGILEAAKGIAPADVFIGDRGVYHAIAHGLNRKILCYEPNTLMRNPIFGCPFGQEICPEKPTQYELFDSTIITFLKDAKKGGLEE